MQQDIPVTIMRGGTSKGLFFAPGDLPDDPAQRDRVLLALMGSPDARQIDGLGGAHPLTSKVAIVSPASVDNADVDYLFLQVSVDEALVSDAQNCGNILAGVAPFAIEKGMVKAEDGSTEVRIHMVNTGGIAIARIQTPGCAVVYSGDARIDGVPGHAAPISLDFEGVAGASCGSLLPSGNAIDEIDGIQVTLIDNGMPVIVVRADALGKTGYESPEMLEQDKILKEKVESIRLQAGPMMNLGDVTGKTVPKISLIAPGQDGGVLSTRTFIPQRVHEAIGVLGAVSVATACLVPGTVAQDLVRFGSEKAPGLLDIEHPTGFFTVDLDIENTDGNFLVKRSAILRTARKLMDGTAYVPETILGQA